MGHLGSPETTFAALVSLAGEWIAALQDDGMRRELTEALAITYHEMGATAKARAILGALIKEDVLENAGRGLADIASAAARCGMSRAKLLDILDLLHVHGDAALQKRIDRLMRRLVVQGHSTHPQSGSPKAAVLHAGSPPLDPFSLAHVKRLACSGDLSRYEVAMERLLWGETKRSCEHARALILLETTAELGRAGHAFKAGQAVNRAREWMSVAVGPRCLTTDGSAKLAVCPHYASAAFALLCNIRQKGHPEELIPLAEKFHRTRGGGFAGYAGACVRLFLPQMVPLALRMVEVFAGDDEATAAGLDELVSHYYEQGQVKEMLGCLRRIRPAERRIWSLATEILGGEEHHHIKILSQFATLRESCRSLTA